MSEVDWALPGMEKFSKEDIEFFKRVIEDDDGAIVNTIESLGWVLWPISNKGFYDEHLLRKIADFIEIQNKPFWDEYDKYCEELYKEEE